eukprot:6522083-Alexandrium_andersonii.AAC.1
MASLFTRALLCRPCSLTNASFTWLGWAPSPWPGFPQSRTSPPIISLYWDFREGAEARCPTTGGLHVVRAESPEQPCPGAELRGQERHCTSSMEVQGGCLLYTSPSPRD